MCGVARLQVWICMGCGIYILCTCVVAGYTISIPYLNTTLSRVDVYEVAAIVEILLACRRVTPRNVTPDISGNLRRDVVSCIRCLVNHRAPSCLLLRPHLLCLLV